MYRTFNKFFKIAGKGLLSQNFTKTVLKTYSRTLTYTTKSNFSEKFEKVGRQSNRIQGNLNLKQVFAGNETPQRVFEFLENNIQSMNDADYIDALVIVSQKLSNDNTDSVARKFRLSNVFEIFKNWVKENADKYYESHSTSLLVVSFESEKFNLGFFDNVKKAEIARHSLDFIDRSISSGRSQTNFIVSSLIMIYQQTDSNEVRSRAEELLKAKLEDLKDLNHLQLLKISSKIQNLRNSFMRNNLTASVSKHIFNNLENERLGVKSKIFSVWSEISKNTQLMDYNYNLTQLLNDIKSHKEDYDPNVILNVLSGLVHFEDSTLANSVLKEIADIIVATIKHNPETIKYDLIFRSVELINKIESERAINKDHITTFIDFLTGVVPQNRNSSYIGLFSLMKKHRYDNKANIEKVFNLLASREVINRLPVDANLEAFRQVVKIHLGDNAISVVHSNLTEALKLRENTNIRYILENLNKSLFFTSDKTNELSEKYFNQIAENINGLEFEVYKIKNVVNILLNNLENVRNYREQLVDLIMNKIKSNLPTVENSTPNQIYILFMNVMQLPTFTQSQIETYKEIKSIIVKNSKVADRFLNNLQNDLSEGKFTDLTRSVFNKICSIARELVNNEEFVKSHQKILSTLILINYEYSVANSRNNEAHNDQLMRLADQVAEKNQDIKLNFNVNRILRLIKYFDETGIESKILNTECLRILNDEGITNLRVNDLVLLLSKVLKANVQGSEEAVKKRINEENIIEKIDNSNFVGLKIKYLSIANQMNKKGYISDDKMVEVATKFVELFKECNPEQSYNLEILTGLSYTKNDILEKCDVKSLVPKIKEVFGKVQNSRRAIKYIKLLQEKDDISNNVLVSFAQLYTKEQNIDKNTFQDVLDLFTRFRWRGTQVYNKIIADYEELFEKFNSNDQSNLINKFARIDMRKDDVIKAAVKDITVKYLEHSLRQSLFNNLVLLGYHNQEWKDVILSKLVNEYDSYHRHGIIKEFKTLNALWILKDWPENRNELVETSIKILDKQHGTNFLRNKDECNQFVAPLRFSPIYEKLGENTKKTVDEVAQKKFEFTQKSNNFKILLECLKQMNLEAEITNDLYNVYIPNEKIAIFLVPRSNISIIDQKPSHQFEFFANEARAKGLTPVLLCTSQWKFDSKTNENLIKNLETVYQIPNRNTEGNYDFSVLEQLNKTSSE